MVAIVADRIRALAWRGPVDAKVIVDALPNGSLGDIARRVPGTFAAALLEAVAEGPAAGDPRSRAIDLALVELRFEVMRHLGLVRGLSSLGSAGGLLIAIAWSVWARHGEHGLLGLVAGGPERLAMAEGIRAIGIGLATVVFGLGCLATLRKEARDRWAEIQEIARHLDA